METSQWKQKFNAPAKKDDHHEAVEDTEPVDLMLEEVVLKISVETLIERLKYNKNCKNNMAKDLRRQRKNNRFINNAGKRWSFQQKDLRRWFPVDWIGKGKGRILLDRNGILWRQIDL